MKPMIHYVVRHATLIDNGKGELTLKIHTNKEFKDEHPIKARKKAFEYYDNYTHGISLEKKLNPQPNSDVSSDVEEPIDDPVAMFNTPYYKEIVWKAENQDKEHLLTSPAVILVKDDAVIEEDGDKEIKIHYDVDLEEPYDISDLMLFLDNEYRLYEKNGYRTDKETITVGFWDPEIFDHQNENELVFDNHKILATPIDWKPYEVPNWWNDPEFEDLLRPDSIIPNSYLEGINNNMLNEQIRPEKRKKSHLERIQKGENQRVEFKPEMIGQSYDKTRSFEYEITKTIDAFLNTKGGFLYIGVKDDGTISGTNLHGKTEDRYTDEFTSMLNRWFNARGAIDRYVKCAFNIIDDKKIFVIKVSPSFKPIFLKSKEEGQKTKSEFYVRRDASSRPLYDEAMIDYIEIHWWHKKYKK